MASSTQTSAAEPNFSGKRKRDNDLENKSFPRKQNDESSDKTAKKLADQLQKANFILVKETALSKKTLFFANLSSRTTILDIIDFFKDVGEVVRVQFIIGRTMHHDLLLTSDGFKGCGFVEFASSNEAEKALQKSGEYLHEDKIYLDMRPSNYLPKFCLDYEIWKNDYLRQGSLSTTDDKKNEIQKVLFVANLSPQTRILNIVDFFEKVGKVAGVRLIVNPEGKRVGYGFVEFNSLREAKRALKIKNGEYLLDHKIFLDLAKTTTHPPGPKYNLAEKLCYEDYLRRETVNSDGAVAARKKMLVVSNLSKFVDVSDIVDFFEDVGKVVYVRLFADLWGEHVGKGFVQFASAEEAKKALAKKGQFLNKFKMYIEVADKVPYISPPMCFKDHWIWHEENLQESLLIEENETVEKHNETPHEENQTMGELDGTLDFTEAVAVRKKTIYIANLSHQTEISHIIDFFKDVGEVVHVRLIVDHWGDLVGDGFVEFASSSEAKKALEKKNGEYLHDCQIFLNLAETFPYVTQPMYCIDHKVWYEDYLRQENLLIEDEDVEGLEAEAPNLVEEVAVMKKTLFVANLSPESNASNIYGFFRNFGEVVRIRRVVDQLGNLLGCAFVEFASANEAKKAMQEKNYLCLRGRRAYIDVVEKAPYPLRPKYNLAEKLWYEDYLRHESLLIEDDVEKPKVPTSPKVPTKITFPDED